MQDRYNVIVSSMANYIINKNPNEDALREVYNKNANYNPSTDYPEMFLFAFVENTSKNEKYASVSKEAYDKLASMYKEKLKDSLDLEKIIKDEFRLTMTLKTFNDDVLTDEVLINMKSALEKGKEVSGLEGWQKDALEKIDKKLTTKNEDLSEKAPSYKEQIETLDAKKDELKKEQYQKTIEEPAMILGVSQQSFQKMLGKNGIDKEELNGVKIDDKLTDKIAANNAAVVDNTSYIQAFKTVFANKRAFKNADFAIDEEGILSITSGTKKVREKEKISKLCSVKAREVFDRIRSKANKIFNKIKETKDSIKDDIAFIGLDIYADIVNKAVDVQDACGKLKKAVEAKKEAIRAKAGEVKDEAKAKAEAIKAAAIQKEHDARNGIADKLNTAADRIRWDEAGMVSEEKPKTI